MEYENAKHFHFLYKNYCLRRSAIKLLKVPFSANCYGRGLRYNMNSITAIALKEKIDSAEDFQLIDVREPYEHDEFNIGGELIPLNEITQQAEKIATDKPVILYCRKGIRSQIAIQRLQEKFHYQNLYNLIGGTEAWKKHFGV